MMTNRPTDAFLKDCYSNAEARLNQQIRCAPKLDEGCPVIDETGTVCGETDSLSIFKEFRKIYEDCLKKLESSPDGNTILKKLTPFTKIVDDLWEQNTMLVEAVEELEQEATCQVTNLQNKLDKSCQKELHCILKAKERQVQSLNKELSEKNDLLAKNRCHIEKLEEDLKTKRECCKNFAKRLKLVTSRKGVSENDIEDNETEDCNDFDPVTLEKLVNDCVSDWARERNSFKAKADIGERQLQLLTSERNKVMFERNELGKKLQCMATENERLTKEMTREKMEDVAKNQGLTKAVETLMAEKAELLEKINGLQENIKELNSKFKETRWALTSEVAEKHDEVQELKRCMTKLEEQLLQADKQLQFKEDVIKDLRKEIKYCKKSVSNPENTPKISLRDHSPPTQLHHPQSLKISAPNKHTVDDDELKLDIHIFSVSEVNKTKAPVVKNLGDSKHIYRSVEVQTEWSTLSSSSSSSLSSSVPLKMRNVSTQHSARVQKYPRSFGTLTVTPWSGTMCPTDNTGIDYLKETKKNLKGVFTVPFSSV